MLRWSILAVALVFTPTALQAALMEYRVSMVGKNGGTNHPILLDAQLEFAFLWDPGALVPVFDMAVGPSARTTTWPVSNTTVSMKISGTAAHDGVYPAQVDLDIPNGWVHLNDNGSWGDAIDFPRIKIPFNGDVIRVNGFVAHFGDLFFDGATTIQPKPFAAVDVVTWGTPILNTTNPVAHQQTNITSGSAIIIPEPSSWAIVTIAVACLGNIVRKK